MLKSIQKWLHNNFLKKYGFGWLYIGIFLHVAILLAEYCNLKPCRTNNTYILIYYCIVQRNCRCQTMKVKPYIILNMSRKHVNYEEDKNKVPMNKPDNIHCIFHISFFKALLINEGETTRGERESGRTEIGAKRLTGWTGFGAKRPGFLVIYNTCLIFYIFLFAWHPYWAWG